MQKIKFEPIAVISHELKVPLAIINEVIMLLIDEIPGPINNKQKDLLLRAAGNARRLKNIIDELLDESLIESGRLRLHYSLANLNELLRSSAAFFKKMAKDKGVALNYQLPKQQVNIFIDADRVNQVILNLVHNAVKFTEEGGKVTVGLKILESKVRVDVIDTGVGIPKGDLPKVFDKFVHLVKLGGRKRKGLGLGLSIAKKLIEKHGGEIWVESRLRRGSKFYFTLPRFYTTAVLDNQVRDKINRLLEREIPAYLINLLIINFRKIKKRVRIGPRKLFRDLRDIIEARLEKLSQKRTGKPQIIMEDSRRGEYNIIFPKAREKEAAGLCESLKKKIEGYFLSHKAENVFINVGILSYPSQKSSSTTRQFLANLYVKKVYIGSETRRFKRIDYQADMEMLLAQASKEKMQTIDVSEGGICFLSRRRLATDALVRIKLRNPVTKVMFNIKGRVAWIRKTENLPKARMSLYKVGIEFVGPTGHNKKVISKLIRTISS